MELSTKIPILKSKRQIDFSSAIFSLGSCFAVNIAEKFDYFKFQTAVNPFGILFHPLALERFIGFAVNQKAFTEKDIFFHNEQWHSFDTHSGLSNPDKLKLISDLNSKIKSANDRLTKSTHIIITLGTAWVYRNTDSNEIVANCHKVPQKHFTKELLSIQKISNSLQNIVGMIQKANPSAQIIFTVSPVRHIKDGFVENQISKSHLIAALHQTLNTEHCSLAISYFPSYEIMMDELRDYRFYGEDMLHPNQTAINYIWNRFSEAWISQPALPIMQKVEGIQHALAHRPFNRESESHRQFLAKIEAEISSLQSQFPHMVF